MTLKDWKVTGWRIWKHRNKDAIIGIIRDDLYKEYPYWVYYKQNSYNRNEKDSLYHAPSLKKALKYTKQYMEKN